MANILTDTFKYFENFILKYKKKKDILLVIHNELKLSYAYLVYERLRHDNRLRLWFCFHSKGEFLPGNLKKIKQEYKIKCISYKIARFLKWDLIIYPDHRPWFRKKCEKIYIGHGLDVGKKVLGKPYNYGERSCDESGNIIYDKMFVSSEFVRTLIKKHNPKFYPRIRVVGSLFAEKTIELKHSKKIILKNIGLDEKRKTVIVTSTWGKNSLLQNQGFELMKDIPQISQKYNVILSVHLNNFHEKHSNGINWRKYLDGAKGKNVYVCFPGEEPYKYLVCADILITDHTSLGFYYPPLHRPIIFYDNDDVKYDKITVIPEFRKCVYKIKNINNIQDDIENAFASFEPEKMKELEGKIVSHFGHSWQKHEEEIYNSISLSLPSRG